MLPCFSMYCPLALARLPKGKRARGSIPSQWAAIGLNPVAAPPPGPTHRKRRKGLGCLVICRFAGRVRPYRVRVSSEHPASNASQNVSLPAISLPNSRRLGAPSFGAPLCWSSAPAISPRVLGCMLGRVTLGAGSASAQMRFPPGRTYTFEILDSRQPGGCHG